MDPFEHALVDAELVALYPPAEERVWRKDVGRVDEMARRLIAASPMLLVGSTDADGHCDVTPRGGPPGFVTVLNEHTIAIPDATGNRRLDTLRNIVATGRAGLLFLIPGRSTTLRVNGRACVTARPELLDAMTPVGKAPLTAIVVEPEEVFAHCPKAFVRSHLWEPETWPDPAELPTAAEVTLAHLADDSLTVADIEARERDSLRDRLQ